jgi:hypothetical protein
MIATMSDDLALRVELALQTAAPTIRHRTTEARRKSGPGFFLVTVERTGEIAPLNYVGIKLAERSRGLPHSMIALARETNGKDEVCVIVQDLVGATEFVAATLPL